MPYPRTRHIYRFYYDISRRVQKRSNTCLLVWVSSKRSNTQPSARVSKKSKHVTGCVRIQNIQLVPDRLHAYPNKNNTWLTACARIPKDSRRDWLRVYFKKQCHRLWWPSDGPSGSRTRAPGWWRTLRRRNTTPSAVPRACWTGWAPRSGPRNGAPATINRIRYPPVLDLARSFLFFAGKHWYYNLFAFWLVSKSRRAPSNGRTVASTLIGRHRVRVPW